MKKGLLFVMASVVSFGLPVSGAGQSATRTAQARRRETTVTLREFLLRLDQKCDCFFTLEEGASGSEFINAMEIVAVPDGLMASSPQEAMDQLLKTVPHLTYDIDKTNARIVHIRDARLVNRPGYPLDQRIGAIGFSGKLDDLVQSIADKGVRIGRGGSFIGPSSQSDFLTLVHVRGQSLYVRTALSNFIPLGQRDSRRRILWITYTDLGDASADTGVMFPIMQ